ncbi:class I SAM-dependent methyltransferase [Baekduia alba]|uniref:class I SAM-dependent methyltransferase n=1 Tax=Baekduia alba TaxID=2997333 RepID=UPI0023408907|nr:class I SAM-dependent methyltransferase [Baekduia alba]
MGAGDLYDTIGVGYGAGRREDPRIAAAIWAGLGDARTVLNVGAGAGSYEPRDRYVLAVEPSAVMRAQRPAGAAACVDARAEALPFDDDAFDVVMTVLSDHHWADNAAGLRECARVGRRVVLFNWENALTDTFWLIRDYVPEFNRYAGAHPSLADRAATCLTPDAEIAPVPIPWDCEDAFFHAFWRRPDAYLREDVRAVTSVWSRFGPAVEARAVAALAADLECGAWAARNAELLDLDACDVGARLVVADTAGRRS